MKALTGNLHLMKVWWTIALVGLQNFVNPLSTDIRPDFNKIEMTLEVLTMGVGTTFEITLWIDQIRKVVYAGEMTGGQNSRIRTKTIVSSSVSD